MIASEEVTTFLFTSFEETILPAVLVCVWSDTSIIRFMCHSYCPSQMNTERLNHCQPFSALFKITRIQLETMQDNLLPLRLGNIVHSDVEYS